MLFLISLLMYVPKFLLICKIFNVVRILILCHIYYKDASQFVVRLFTLFYFEVQMLYVFM